MNNTDIALGDNVSSTYLVPQKIVALERMTNYINRSLITKIIFVQCQMIASRQTRLVEGPCYFESRLATSHEIGG